MRKHALRSILALLVIGAGLGAAAPANATLWLNFQDEHYSLFGNLNEGYALQIEYNGGSYTSTSWSFSPDTSGNTFSNLVWSESNPPISTVAGVSGNNMNNGTLVIAWHSTGELNQTWKLTHHVWDGNGADCYAFTNGNVQPGREIVLGVSGGVMANGTPIRIWDWLGHADQYWCAYKDDGSGPLNQ